VQTRLGENIAGVIQGVRLVANALGGQLQALAARKI
jgi:hypothetical protein